MLVECIEHGLELHLRHLGEHPDVLDVPDRRVLAAGALGDRRGPADSPRAATLACSMMSRCWDRAECGYDSKDDHPYAMRYAAMPTPGFSDHPVLILVSTYLKGAHPEPGRFLPETHTAQDRDRPGGRRDGWAIPKPQQMGRSARCDQ